MNAIDYSVWYARAAFRRVFRKRAINSVIDRIVQAGWSIDRMEALELFAGNGEYNVKYYANRLKSLVAWEIDPHELAIFKQRFPNAVCEQRDTYLATTNDQRQFDWLIVDNPMQQHGSHHEHFDLFPSLARLAKPTAVITLNVLPRANRFDRERYPHLFGPEQLAARAEFYQTDHPELLSSSDFASAYRRHLTGSDKRMDWWHIVPRSPLVWYFCCGLSGESS